MFPIEHNIPIPPAKREGTPARKDSRHVLYPFESMTPGDSFLVPFGDEPHGTIHNRANNAMCRNRSATGRTYTARYLPEGVRVWRVK